jgi:AcrR family transcriptional regulator
MVKLYSYSVYSRFPGAQVTARKQQLEPRKPPVQKRSKATVDDILAAAAQVFETHGYSAGTTNRIAERAGVSVGTLYQYYPSKEAIAVALLERHITDTSRRLKEWVGHMVAEQHGLGAAIEDYVEGMLDTHSGRPRLQHMLLEETPLPPRVHRTLLDAERQGARTVAGLLRLYPETRHGNLDRAGFMLVQTVESLTHRFAAHPDEAGMKRPEFVAELVAMLQSYLSCEREPLTESPRRRPPGAPSAARP